MKLTEKQMIAIIKEKRISQCSKAEYEQVMDFAFGSDFMKSDDKGSKKVYCEKSGREVQGEIDTAFDSELRKH
jgi:hypothetical protein